MLEFSRIPSQEVSILLPGSFHVINPVSHIEFWPLNENGRHVVERHDSHFGPEWRPANAAPNQDEPATSDSNPATSRTFIGDDWAFLENLGDPTDELYMMDNSFRQVLQNQADPVRIP